MPVSHATFAPRDRSEPKALVVAISVLQLALIAIVWLLALVPVALMALTALVIQSVGLLVSRTLKPSQDVSP